MRDISFSALSCSLCCLPTTFVIGKKNARVLSLNSIAFSHITLWCFPRRREHQEQVIESMMKYNQFGHADDMPPDTPLEEHPFWQKTDSKSAAGKHESEFRGMIKERKEWQKKEDKSFEEIFNEKK
jgi:hypothetical protein